MSSRLISRDSEREGGWSDHDGRVALRKEAKEEGGRGGIGVEGDERKRSSGWKVNEWGDISREHSPALFLFPPSKQPKKLKAFNFQVLP